MTDIHIKDYPDIGLIQFERSKRARRMNISIRPFKGVRVAVPYGMTFKQAEKIALTRRDWIINHVKQMKIKEQHLNNQPPDIPINEAEAILSRRVEELAQCHGFRYNRVSVKRMSSLWGSCSAKDNINLNIKLLKLPAHLRDYVILHELVHTIHKNHGALFWKTLSEVCDAGDAKALQRKLTKLGKGVL